MSLFLFVLFFVCSVDSTQYTFSVDITNVIADISSPFYGFTIDFWAANDPYYGKKWGNAGALTIDLSNKNLISLVSAITPAILRVGGSPEDSIIYNNSNGACLDINASLPSYGCSQVKNNYGCLNISRWQEINTFAIKTNCTLVFGLNACYGRSSASSSMNFTNIKGLLEITKQITSDNLYAFEFGNELNGGISTDAYASDFVSLHNLLNDIWPQNAPYLIGADVDGLTWTSKVLEDISTKGDVNTFVHRLTYHSYPNCNYPNTNTVFSLECLEVIQERAVSWSNLANNYSLMVWMGEGSEHGGGGITNVSNTFVDNFYYLYQLCEVAGNGVHGTMRSDLVGGDYELINHRTFIANPDYWILWMWKQIIGNQMYSSNLLPKSNLKAYSFKSVENGKIVLVFINFDLWNNAVIDVQIYGVSIDDGFTFEQYDITPLSNDGNLQTTEIAVNGVAMEFKNGKFPMVKGRIVSSLLTVEPARLAFVVLIPA